MMVASLGECSRCGNPICRFDYVPLPIDSLYVGEYGSYRMSIGDAR
jgi:hypothetical protein